MQAARGASLSDADGTDETDTSTPTVRRPQARLLFVTVAVALLAVDQLTKVWAVASLTPGHPQEVVGSLLRLDLTRNPGAAFSTGTSHTGFFTALAIVAAIVTIYFAMRAASRAWGVALGFLFAGIVGNLVDRVAREPRSFHGHVVDFLELPHWPIFNVADTCITVAAVLILVLAYRGVRLGGDAARPDVTDGEEGHR
ncbi:signal peptidase II [Nocardioides sp. KR10-350]|uniref:signal peptidase II n=1 Tax=Nocardioides cheoyonin TaxID=3156615 RepID=UPI0032B4985A